MIFNRCSASWVEAELVGGLRAVDFVMHELTIADRANVMITTEDDNLAIEQIEKLQ